MGETISGVSGPDRTSGQSGRTPTDDGAAPGVPLEEIIPPEAAAELLRAGIEIDTVEKAEALRAAMMLSVSRSPLPSPEMLYLYDEYKPGMGTEVVDWVKDQTRHRQNLENLVTIGSEKRMGTAQQNAVAVAISGIVAAAAVSIWNTWAAIAIAAVAVGGPSVATILARFIDRRDPPA